MNERGDGWYWCLLHQRVERRGECRADDRLGPYGSPQEAAGWRERHTAREERWEEEDRRWKDEDEQEEEEDG